MGLFFVASRCSKQARFHNPVRPSSMALRESKSTRYLVRSRSRAARKQVGWFKETGHVIHGLHVQAFDFCFRVGYAREKNHRNIFGVHIGAPVAGRLQTRRGSGISTSSGIKSGAHSMAQPMSDIAGIGTDELQVFIVQSARRSGCASWVCIVNDKHLLAWLFSLKHHGLTIDTADQLDQGG